MWSWWIGPNGRRRWSKTQIEEAGPGASTARPGGSPAFAFLGSIRTALGLQPKGDRCELRSRINRRGPYSPDFARWLLEAPWFQAVLLTLLVIYTLGWAVSPIVGRRVLHTLEALVARIPLVSKVYGSTKQLVQAFQKKPGGICSGWCCSSFPIGE